MERKSLETLHYLDSHEYKDCPRVIRPHKYERLTKNNQIWWNNKFKELEDTIKAPDHKKFSELRKLFTKKELRNLYDAGLHFEIDDTRDRHFKRRRRSAIMKRRSTFQADIFVPPRRMSIVNKKETFVDRIIDFYKKSPEDAKVWSPKPKRELDETENLLERAALLEEELAEDFDKWFSSIETHSTSEINKDVILKIFEINSSLPINITLKVNMQLMKSVPDVVAKYLGCQELAISSVIKHEIDSDRKATKIKPINRAFGTMLPPDMRKYKYINDNKINLSSEHRDLETFAAVFRDIMDLETSRRFVSWLRARPGITPPPFLQKSYMARQRRAPKKSFFIRQIYEAKVWTVDKQSVSSSEKDSDSNLSSLSGDDSSSIMFLV